VGRMQARAGVGNDPRGDAQIERDQLFALP
jgi:hypothetical protein